MGFWQLVSDHGLAIGGLLLYVFLAAVNNLQEDKFEFYPWFRGTLRSLANHVPERYKDKSSSQP